jgi:cytolethal distending toxin subunit B
MVNWLYSLQLDSHNINSKPTLQRFLYQKQFLRHLSSQILAVLVSLNKKNTYNGDTHMPNLATWNMQGANHSTDYKWATGVKNIINQSKVDVACLQECGSQPASAQLLYNPLATADFAVYRWGTARSHLYITHYQWDTNGNRCNLAIASKEEPAYYLLSSVYYGPDWRPAIGTFITDRWYFSIHAISPNGPDATGLLDAIYRDVRGGPFLAVGDFNREPQTIIPPANCYLCPSNLPTYSVAAPLRYIDYMCTNIFLPFYGTVIGGIILSDHYAVKYVMP